jgi:hypothetical protein
VGTAAQEHLRKHMAKMGVCKLCDGLQMKYKGSPAEEIKKMLAVFDTRGDGLLAEAEADAIVRAVFPARQKPARDALLERCGRGKGGKFKFRALVSNVWPPK